MTYPKKKTNNNKDKGEIKSIIDNRKNMLINVYLIINYLSYIYEYLSNFIFRQ